MWAAPHPLLDAMTRTCLYTVCGGYVSLDGETGGTAKAEVGSHGASPEETLRERLRESEQRRQLALDVAELGTWTWDLATGSGEIDARGAEIVGIDPGAVGNIATAQRSAIHPEDLARVEAEVVRGIESRQIFTLEYRSIHPDGTIRYVDSRAVAITDETGRPVRLTGTNRDVTHERLLEGALRTSEARQTFLVRLGDALRPLAGAAALKAAAAEAVARHLGIAAAGYVEVDPDGELAFASGEYHDGRVTALTGWYRLSDFGAIVDVIRRGNDLYVEDFEHDRRVAPAGLALVKGLRLRSAAALPLIKKGRLVAFLYAVDCAPRQWSAEDRIILRDVADRTWAAVERARAETTVRDAEARLQSALDAANLGTFVWYVNEDRTDSDLRMLRLFGLGDDDPLTLRDALDSLLHHDDRERYAEGVRRAIDPDGPGTLREDIRVLHPDGSLHWIAVTGRTVFEGEPRRAVRLIGVAADITTRKSIEEALRNSEERLKESDRRKDEFLAMLAHELRNPLAPIRTGLELIRMAGDTSAAVGRVRTMMERQVGHMVRLIDDLLDVSRITSGKIQLRRKPTPLADLVNSAVEANRAALAASHIELTIQVPPEPCILDVDPTRLVQVLSNLLHNAAKFTPSNGHVTLSATCIGPDPAASAGQLVLAVSDNGVGISREMLPRVFDLFTQGEPSTGRSQPGLGIGLALARRLIEMHGGNIEATSAGPGRGSVFTIRLPIASRVAAAELAQPSVAAERVARRIVIIDDNEDAAQMLAMLVEQRGGEARVAHDGAAGLRAIAEFRPDVVLLDIGLPGMDGYETCRRIRMEPFGADLLIVALTGWGQEQDKQRSTESGFDAHLTKPADPLVLERILIGLPADDR